MPVGIISAMGIPVKEICNTIQKTKTHESLSANDLLELLDFFIDFILSQKRKKSRRKRFNFCLLNGINNNKSYFSELTYLDRFSCFSEVTYFLDFEEVFFFS